MSDKFYQSQKHNVKDTFSNKTIIATILFITIQTFPRSYPSQLKFMITYQSKTHFTSSLSCLRISSSKMSMWCREFSSTCCVCFRKRIISVSEEKFDVPLFSQNEVPSFSSFLIEFHTFEFSSTENSSSRSCLKKKCFHKMHNFLTKMFC